MTKLRALPQTWPIYTLHNGRLYDDEGKRRVRASFPVPYFKNMQTANAWLETEDLPGTVRELRELKQLRKRHGLQRNATIVGRNNQSGLVEYATGKVIEM